MDEPRHSGSSSHSGWINPQQLTGRSCVWLDAPILYRSIKIVYGCTQIYLRSNLPHPNTTTGYHIRSDHLTQKCQVKMTFWEGFNGFYLANHARVKAGSRLFVVTTVKGRGDNRMIWPCDVRKASWRYLWRGEGWGITYRITWGWAAWTTGFNGKSSLEMHLDT